MKKKGLIISTVVMVVVLIASLTTATYAWFTATATAKVNDIAFNVSAASSVIIGVRNQGVAGNNATQYRSGDSLVYNAGNWTGGNEGLGTLIETTAGMGLSVTAGVGSSANSGASMDETYKHGELSTLYKASGNDFESLETPEATTVNVAEGDIIDLNMGIAVPQGKEVNRTYGKITVTIPAGQTFIGMAAALRCEITVGDKTYGCDDTNTAGDIFGSTHFDTQVTSADKRIEGDGGASTFVFYFMINDTDNPATAGGAPTAFSIRMFVSGYDTDCCIDATGTSASILIEFDAYKDTLEGTDNWTQLTLNGAGD